MEPSFKNKIRPVASVSATSTGQPSFASKARPVTATPVPEVQEEGTMKNLFKGLVTAPATLLARPLQLAAEAVMPGDNTEAINRFSTEKLGGIVAPVPETGSDVLKDVGRAGQTIALGTGAPIAGGTLFGVGAALEKEGSNIASTEGLKELAASTALGAGGSKLLSMIGKPLLNASGKVIGKITPKTVQDVAARGASAVEQFMARHEIVPASVKPAIAEIPKIADKVDESVNNLFKGAGTKAKGVIQSEYPGMTKENIAKHYEDVEVKRLMEPTTQPGATFKEAARVAEDAKRRGIDLETLARNNKIYATDLIDGDKFVTHEIASALRDDAMNGGKEILRPALQAAEAGVPRVPISEVRNEMIRKVASAPSSKYSPQQKSKFASRINKEYADDSVTAKLYRDGYSLTNFYDSKLNTSSGVYKNKFGSAPSIGDSETIALKKMESEVFDDLLRKNAPAELGLDDYFKAQEGRFTLANYLESLNTKKAPQTLLQKGVRKASQLFGAATGASVGGPFGMFGGYQFGGLAGDMFVTAPNPVKIAFLKSIGKTEPEIYSIMKEFAKKSEIDRLIRPKLNAPTTIFQGPTQGGQPFTPNTTGFKTTPVVETKRIFKKGK